MQNNARLRQLGFPVASSILTTHAAIISKDRNGEGSESEYEPDQDETGEADLSDENTDKVIIPPSFHGLACFFVNPGMAMNMYALLIDVWIWPLQDSMASKKSTKTTTKKPRPAKRVLAQQQTTRVTRSKKSLTVQDDASTERSQAEHFTTTEIHVTAPSLPHTTEAEVIAPNLTNLSVTDEQG